MLIFCSNFILASGSRFKQEASHGPSSTFLTFLIVSISSYIIIQPSFTSFSPKIFRLADLDINSK